MESKKEFQGFNAPNYTQVPDELFDDLMVDLSGAELKVLLYIIRRTFGFKKAVDNISLHQLLQGIKTKDGEILDKGTGLSKKTLLVALKTLVLKKIIITERRQSVERGNEPTAYRLNIVGLASNNDIKNQQEKITPTLGVKITPRASSNNSPTQDTVIQQTDLQYRNSNIEEKRNILKDKTEHQEFQTIGELLKSNLKAKADKADKVSISYTEIPEPIKVAVQEISKGFGEGRSARSNTTHTARIFQTSGKREDSFTSLIYQARSITKQQGSVKNRMPYFFSVLEDISGVKDKQAQNGITLIHRSV